MSKFVSPYIGHHVIVRTASAGVHAGTLVQKSGDEVVLEDSRRLWSWSGAMSLSELSKYGPTNPDACKFACPVDVHLLGAIEIIPTTAQAKSVIRGVKEWKS